MDAENRAFRAMGNQHRTLIIMNPLKRQPNLNVDWFELWEQFKESATPLNMAQAREQAQRLNRDEIWMNEIYQVNVDRFTHRENGIVHLSIKRRDKEPLLDWRHKQQIKNQLVGDECEALELFPAESRLVDGANQFHLWAFSDPAQRIPVGFWQRMVHNDSPPGGKQRRLQPD